MAAAHTGNQEISDFWDTAPRLFEQLNDAGALLAVSETVPSEVEEAIELLVAALPTTPDTLAPADPYLVSALYAGAMQGIVALRESEPLVRRRALRIPLERARQALRDLLSEEPVMDDQPLKRVAAWLIDNEEISRSTLARVLDVSPATLKRWADPASTSAPKDDEARRLRTLARVVNHLRWSFTAPGVVEWLTRPHPSLKGAPPESLLDDPEGGVALIRLAAGTRAMTLT